MYSLSREKIRNSPADVYCFLILYLLLSQLLFTISALFVFVYGALNVRIGNGHFT
jgi:hypothetical protein